MMTYREREKNKFAVQDRIKRLTYPQEWASYNAAQTQEKLICERLLAELLDALPQEEIVSKRGGRPLASYREMMMRMHIYSYSGYSSRRCISDMKIAKERGLIQSIPHFNTLLNHYNSWNVSKMLMRLIYLSSLPLKNVEETLIVDSSGFSTSRFERWLDIKTQRPAKRRHWKKAHLSVGAKSKIITSIYITDGDYGDSPYLVPLLEKSVRGFK